MSAPTRQEIEAQIAQFLEPWAWETTSYNATVARDDALAKAALIVEAFPALASQAAQPAEADGGRPLPFSRDDLGRFVREAWVRWAQTQGNPKPTWLVPYDDLPEDDKEADRQIGEAVARWTLIGDAATPKAPTSTAGEVAARFWLIVHEPGKVPERKGSWPREQLPKIMREFIAARPTAYLTVLTVGADGQPYVEHGPEALQIADGRSMSVGSKHNARTREAHAPAPNDDLRAALEWYAERVADCRKITPEGDNARQALDLDGGKRARAALKENRRG